MRKTMIPILVLTAIMAVSACEKKVPKKVKLKSFNDSASYCIGMIMAENLNKSGEIEYINTDIFYTAMRHALDSGELQIPKEDMKKIMQEYGNMVRKAQQEKWKAGEEQRKHEAEENLDKGNAFIEENKSKEGVITTETGLQYKIITKGNGPKPKATDKVRVHYHGMLVDGTVFDSSVDRGEPTEFVANRVIKGWQEALQLMPVGSKWTLYIPATLAYGDKAAGDKIKPGSALIFDVELLDIVTDKK